MRWRRGKSGKAATDGVGSSFEKGTYRRIIMHAHKMHACMHKKIVRMDGHWGAKDSRHCRLRLSSTAVRQELITGWRAVPYEYLANEKSPYYVIQIKDRAFSEAKHSATRSLNLKRDKYYKHRLYMMCVVQIVITFDPKTGYIEKRSRYVTLPW